MIRSKVRYLKIIEKSGYQALPWVRYITQNGGNFLASLYLSIISQITIFFSYRLPTAHDVIHTNGDLFFIDNETNIDSENFQIYSSVMQFRNLGLHSSE